MSLPKKKKKEDSWCNDKETNQKLVAQKSQILQSSETLLSELIETHHNRTF